MSTTADASPALRRAAEKLAAADIILVAAGAGFSADSGLPVYNDIARVEAYQSQGLEYQDLCDPYWLEDDSEVFYGFWGNCLNTYRETTTHPGFEILKKWQERLRHRRRIGDQRFLEAFHQLRQQGMLPADVTEGMVTHAPFFVYTSNVDGHFHRHFERSEIYELHGSLEMWQCAGVVDGSKITPCDVAPRELPPDLRFAVDPSTMRADGAVVGKCEQCGGLRRPNVLMFHDKSWVANVVDEYRYVAWEAVIEKLLEDDPKLNLVVLEIGCGLRVPSVRKETEMVVADAFARCASSDRRASQVSLIRINPDYPECDHPVLQENQLAISIQSTGLAALTLLDDLIS